ncbi:hypothetical protein WJX81_005478 [Elliptochloris bilobata]|uniref:Uncharacterized protein n=1 Tax=Elliptochloris bilobata TaxID=381761 RepID=A0AAW1QJC8_9CHLO
MPAAKPSSISVPDAEDHLKTPSTRHEANAHVIRDIADLLDSPGLASSYQPWSPGASQLPSSLYSPAATSKHTPQPAPAADRKYAFGNLPSPSLQTSNGGGVASPITAGGVPARFHPGPSSYLQPGLTRADAVPATPPADMPLTPPAAWRADDTAVHAESHRKAQWQSVALTPRAPLRDAVSVLNQPGVASLPDETLSKVAVMCHVAHSKGCMPEDLDERLVDDLVALQLSASKPIRAPWYREGPRTEPFGRRSDWAPRRPSHQVSGGSHSAPSVKPTREHAASLSRAANKENKPAQEGTGFFCPKR